MTAAANPYAVAFFAALFPQFLKPDAPLVPQIVVLGATYLVIDGIILLTMGASATKILSYLGAHAGMLITRVSGALMILAAALLAMRDIEPGTNRQ